MLALCSRQWLPDCLNAPLALGVGTHSQFLLCLMLLLLLDPAAVGLVSSEVRGERAHTNKAKSLGVPQSSLLDREGTSALQSRLF